MINTIRTKFAVVVLASTLAVASSAHADSVTASLEGSGSAIGTMIEGSGTIFEGGSQFFVVSVKFVDDSAIAVLKGVSTGVEVSLNVTGDVVSGLSKATGKVLETTFSTAGTIFSASGEVVFFVPKTTAESLFYSARY